GLPADGERGDLGFVSALAWHRSDACTRSISQFENHHHRGWQGWAAGYSRQRRRSGGIRPQNHPDRGRCDAEGKRTWNLLPPHQHTPKTDPTDPRHQKKIPPPPSSPPLPP